jgi:hypothetical protein
MERRRRPWWAWALACLLGLAALAGIILAVWKLPALLYGDVSSASADARLQAASGFRTAVVAGLAGLAALGSLAMAIPRHRHTEAAGIGAGDGDDRPGPAAKPGNFATWYLRGLDAIAALEAVGAEVLGAAAADDGGG